METADVLIIGSGPAGLCCAIYLHELEPNLKITILEAGRDIRNRNCPAEQGMHCTSCGDCCNVISGFGGCLCAGMPIKASNFPSGRRLELLLGEDFAQTAAGLASKILFSEPPASLTTDMESEFSGIHIRQYGVRSYTAEEISISVSRLRRYIDSQVNIKLALRTSVEDIIQDQNGLRVISRLKTSTRHQIYAHKVVVATGRGGLFWWNDVCKRLNIKYQIPSSSIGIRFECPVSFTKNAWEIHPDFKFTVERNGIKFKSFCFCAGPAGGKIKLTDYSNRYSSLDGYSIPNTCSSNDLTIGNFAILAQLTDHNGNPRTFDWIDSNIIKAYFKENPNNPGKPISQWYPDFKHHSMACSTLAMLENKCGFIPSSPDTSIGRLDRVFADDLIHKGFCEVVEDFLTRINPGLDIHNHLLPHIAVSGIELESLWNVIETDHRMQTSLPELYCIGDCSGIAQGVLQAGAAGISAAIGIHESYSAK